MDSPRHPHSDLIDEVGKRIVAAQFKLTAQRLHMWRVRGIPYGHRAAFAALATVHNVATPAGFLDPPVRIAA